MLLEQGQAPEKNRSKLFEQVFQLLLEGKHKHAKVQAIARPKLVRHALRLLAYTLTVDNRDTESRGALEERLYRDELDEVREQLKKVPRWDGALRQFLDDLAEKVGVLGPHDGGDADWRFWHRTFKEALTAEYLASLPREELLARAAQVAGQESRWAEPFALVTGQVQSADTLVRQLVESNRTLGLRALATAQQVSDATLDEILALTDDLEARSKVFEQIPQQVDAPERALKLIDRLRRRTRDGNDLFWLDFVTGQLAAEQEDVAETARDLQQRFFDHIPAPPDGLFETVSTRDGEVDLWCTIPAGRYRLGSPEDEEDRYGDEGPRHTVEITAPFQLAAVPVTQAQFGAFDSEHRSHFQGEHRPVDSVTWFQAMAFCDWLSRFPGMEGARLPTEEEWEVACRAGTDTRYWNGNSVADLAEVGWFDDNSKGQTHDVGEKPANAWGLYDVHGNVWEWTASRWKDDYSQQADGLTVDPNLAPADLAEPLPRALRVVRGGSYGNSALLARSAYRSHRNPRHRFWSLGFRVLLPFSPSGHRP